MHDQPRDQCMTRHTFVPAEADLGIVKLVSDEVVRNGTVVNWTIVVTNHGPDDALNVRVGYCCEWFDCS